MVNTFSHRHTSPTRRFFTLLVVLWLALLALVPVATIPKAEAATGDMLRTITVTPGTGCGTGVGIAFDGTDLLLSCMDYPHELQLTRVNPADGTNVGTLAIVGIDAATNDILTNDIWHFAAISWDGEHDLLWMVAASYWGHAEIYSGVVDKVNNTVTVTFAFAHRMGGDSFAGLAYDGTDDTLWLGGESTSNPVVYHYSLTGVQLGYFSIYQSPGGGHTGIVVADATTLYLGRWVGSQIHSRTKDGTNNVLVATLTEPVLDLECDNTSFVGKSAVWSRHTNDILYAFEVPTGQCAEGGVVGGGEVEECEAHFLQPIDEGVVNTVQKGRVIPIKVQVLCDGVETTGLTPTIQLLNGDKTDGTATTADMIETLSSAAADTTGVMREADGFYIYNLKVPTSATTNQLFTIRVRPNGDTDPASAIYALLRIRK